MFVPSTFTEEWTRLELFCNRLNNKSYLTNDHCGHSGCKYLLASPKILKVTVITHNYTSHLFTSTARYLK